MGQQGECAGHQTRAHVQALHRHAVATDIAFGQKIERTKEPQECDRDQQMEGGVAVRFMASAVCG